MTTIVVAGIAFIVVAAAAYETWGTLTDEPSTNQSYRDDARAVSADAQSVGRNGWPEFAACIEECYALELASWRRADEQAGLDGGSFEPPTAQENAAHLKATATDPAWLERFDASLDAPRYVRPWFSDGSDVFGEFLWLNEPTNDLHAHFVAEMLAAAEAKNWKHFVRCARRAAMLASITERQLSWIEGSIGVRMR
ncbi:MAG: hypothetical protein AB8G96_04630 [Phycisphaerales bacterium]